MFSERPRTDYFGQNISDVAQNVTNAATSPVQSAIHLELSWLSLQHSHCQTITVNDERYLAMTNEFFIPQLARLGPKNCWVEQGDATA